MRIVVAHLKGGTGKTTTAVGLSEAAAESLGRCLLVDADPQARASALRWADLAASDGAGLRSEVVSVPTSDLGRRLAALGEWPAVVIDTPPGELRIVSAAIAATDVLVVPCRPTLADLDRLGDVLAVADGLGRVSVIALTQVRGGTRASSDARAAIEAQGRTVLKTTMPMRESIAQSYGTRISGDFLGAASELWAELAGLLLAEGHADGR